MPESLEKVNRDLVAAAGEAFPKRTIISGDGPEDARLFLIGESPGPPDAVSGLPFQGPVGDVVGKMLGAIGLKREDCYLTNVVKYISRGSDLKPKTIEFFLPYLHREITAVSPDLIVTMGAMPTQMLLGTTQPISRIRGRRYDLHGINLIPTFNPAYVLRDPTKKKEVWEDLKMVRDLLS